MKKSSVNHVNTIALAAISMVLIVSMFAIAYAEVAQISITRYAPESAETDTDVDIRLFADIDENNLPSIYILYEYIPSEFTIVNYGGGAFDYENRRIKWYKFSMFGLPMVDTNFTYTIRANEAGTYDLTGYAKGTVPEPFNTTGASMITFNGTVAPVDFDGDGIIDEDDNCPFVANPLQEDYDVDGAGDACDLDDDNDGDPDTSDCADFDDTRYHGATDICGNGIDENCDGLDAECGVDSDGDGIEDAFDNCPNVNNPAQANFDGDAQGDACDIDDDNDNDPDTTDCNDQDGSIYNGATDICGNGIDEDCDGQDLECVGPIMATRTLPYSAEPDAEFDVGVFVNVDEGDKPSLYTLMETIPLNVVLTDLGGGQYSSSSRVLKWTVVESVYHNTHVEDRTFTYKAKSSASGVHTFSGTVKANSVNYGTQGDVDILISGDSEPDTDGDGVVDSVDNCPYTGNANQNDVDNDGIGDVCDADNDNDGDPDTSDCAPYDENIYTGAPEICDNQIDDNCNGQTDENCETCTDIDGDGYGSPASGICPEPTLDCDDTDESVYPGAPETCGDGIDQDCNGADLACAIDYPIEVDSVDILDNDGNPIAQVSVGMQFNVNVTNSNVGGVSKRPMQIIQIMHNDVPVGMMSVTNTIPGGGTSVFSGMFTMPDTSTPGTYTIKVFSWNHWASQEGWESYSETRTRTFTVV